MSVNLRSERIAIWEAPIQADTQRVFGLRGEGKARFLFCFLERKGK